MSKPEQNETEKDYMNRCMNSEDMKQYEYDLRLGMCRSLFANKNTERVNFQINVPLHKEFSSAIISKRTEQFAGKETLVVPMVIKVEGVHNGVFYPASEIKKYVKSWNGRPVPVFHPEDEKDGSFISCNDPKVLEKAVGSVFNASVDGDGKISAEAWIDVERCKKVCPELLAMINNNEKIDVSTGLWGDTIYEEGTWNGEKYSEVLINYRPDHVAVLPGQEGACNWEDGCGIRLNIQSGNFYSNFKTKGQDSQKTKEACDLNSKKTYREKKEMVTEQRKKAVSDVLANKLMPFRDEQKDWLEQLSDVDFERVISLSEKTKTCSVCNPDAKKNEETKKNEAPMTMEEYIENAPPEFRDKLKAIVAKGKEAMGVTNSRTPEEFIGNAPAGIREMLSGAWAKYEGEKKSKIETILKNSRNRFTRDQLIEKSGSEIDSIVALVGNDDTDYSGQSGGQRHDQKVNKYERQSDGRGVPQMARLDFSKK